MEAYTYTPGGNVKTIARNGKTLLEYLTDKNGRITKVTDAEGDSTGYTYDAAGRLKTVTDNVAVAATYNYNADSTIASVYYGTGINEVYGYDSDKNIITLTNHKADQSTLDNYAYTYDNNGNLIAESDGTRYTYDSFNRLVETVKSDGTWQQNVYDATGLRMATVENGTYTQYSYDRDSIIADYDKNEQRKTRYVRGNDLISQKDKEGTTSYYLHNAHGDVTKLVDSSGNVRNSYSYDAFGNTTTYTEQVENRFRYTGEQYDSVIGQIYLRARYYDPSIGRFTQEDPYRGDGLNLYTYVSNNPVNYIDPTGLAKCVAGKNFDKALDGLQTVLDIAGFVPGLGDIMDAVNLGISVFRGNVLDAVFSSIAMIPGLGSAIATPLKTIFNAVGNATGITKAIGNLGKLFGGTNKIVSKLDGISASLKTFANKIPNLIASLKNNWLVKSLIGKKQLNNIVMGVRSGINSLITRANEVISSVKKVVKKDIKETAKNTPKTNPANGGCFTAGTLVSTEDGQRPIEEVKVGDYVLSENPETGKKGLKKVVKTFIHEKYTLIHVYAGDTMIETTEEHPFWVEGKGWVFAGELNEGDVLRLKSGENVKVTKLKSVNLKEPVKVYNFEVEDWHTYFVSDINVLVHNKAMKYHADIYEPSPKHNPKSGWGTADPFYNNVNAGQKALETAYSSSKTKQLYNYVDGKLVKFQPDSSSGKWHAYTVNNPAKEVPADVLREMLDDKIITNVEYKKFTKNK